MLLIEQVHKETMNKWYDRHTKYTSQMTYQSNNECIKYANGMMDTRNRPFILKYKISPDLPKSRIHKEKYQLTSSSWISLLLSCHVIYLTPLRLVKSLKQYSSSQLYLGRKINIRVNWQISWKKQEKESHLLHLQKN